MKTLKEAISVSEALFSRKNLKNNYESISKILNDEKFYKKYKIDEYIFSTSLIDEFVDWYLYYMEEYGAFLEYGMIEYLRKSAADHFCRHHTDWNKMHVESLCNILADSIEKEFN